MSASHVGRETEIKALGRTWRLARWTRARWEEFTEWAKTRIPDPVLVALKYLDRFPGERMKDVVVCHALEMKNRYLAIDSPEMGALLGSIEGATKMLWLLLRQHHPDVTDDDAIAIALEMGEEALKQSMEKAAGKVEGQVPNPQAPAE